jgi:hypothetical protein
MTEGRVWLNSFVPLLLSATGTTSQCLIVTDSSSATVLISGTVVYMETAGGCWRLEDEEGRHYELLPDQAPAQLLQDGLRATVSGQPADESDTGCEVGLPFAVRRIVSMEPTPAAR